MSTEIKDRCATSWGPHMMFDAGGDLINLAVTYRGDIRTATMLRADLIAAVEAECDGIFIERASLLPVDPEVFGKGGIVGNDYIVAESAAEAHKWALHYLSLAAYYDAHPPVDEAQVEALATSFAEVAESDGGCKDGWNATIIARALVAQGWSK